MRRVRCDWQTLVYHFPPTNDITYGDSMIRPIKIQVKVPHRIDGFFHEWGFATEEAENSVASYSIAIVEDYEGKIHTVCADNVTFIIEGYFDANKL